MKLFCPRGQDVWTNSHSPQRYHQALGRKCIPPGPSRLDCRYIDITILQPKPFEQTASSTRPARHWPSKRISQSNPNPLTSVHNLQQLRFQYKFTLFILFARLVGFVVFPPHRLSALSTYDVPDDVPSRCHVSLHGLGGFNIDDAGEEEGFAVLAAEVLWLCETGISWVHGKQNGLGGRRRKTREARGRGICECLLDL
jgi:hypothetical protein